MTTPKKPKPDPRAEALRANLARRKEQERAREQAGHEKPVDGPA